MDNLTAISGLILAWPLSSLDNAGRDTFNALAASVTESSNGSKQRLFTKQPGCLGLWIMIIDLSNGSLGNQRWTT